MTFEDLLRAQEKQVSCGPNNGEALSTSEESSL